MVKIKNLAGTLLELLQINGVEFIYGVTGDALFPLFDALARQEDIKFIAVSSEVNAAFMASYQAKLTGRIGVCVATSGPGIANLVNGLADAFFDGAPVLAITGQVASKKIGTRAKQYINQQQLLQSVTYSSELITSGQAFLPVITAALENAINKNTVTHVSIPVDLFHDDSDDNLPLIDTRVLTGEKPGFNGFFNETLQLIRQANNPLLVVGCRQKQLRDDLVTLADKINAAVVTGQQAKGVIPDNHPRLLGGVGEAYLPDLINEVDLILTIGSASFEEKYFPSQIPLVQILDYQTTANYQQGRYFIRGNYQEILQSLKEKIEQKQNQYWSDKIADEKQNLKQMISTQQENNSSPVHPAHLMTVLSENIAEDAVIVCDIGAFAHWFDSYFQAREQTVLISTNWRSMGSAIAGGLSCSLQKSDREVIVLTGDGGLLMSLNELPTAVNYQIPLTIIVVNNHFYELEKLKMEYQNLIPSGIDIYTPDFSALAAACGLEARKVSAEEELVQTIKESRETDAPMLIDVETARVQLPFIN